MSYDYSKLLGKIIELYGSQANFAREMGLSSRSLSLKLNGKIGFKQVEIERACQLLKIKRTDIDKYFFAL